MAIPLETLEQKFLSTTLKNGLSYWKKDQFNVVEDNHSYIKATVYGTDEYISEMFFQGNLVTNVSCTCPNNRTLFCKHIAILYYEKQKDALGLKKSKPRKPRSISSIANTSVKPPSNVLAIKSVIDNMSLAELKALVNYWAKHDEAFKSHIESTLRPKGESAEALYKFYKSQIEKLIKTHKKQGFISYGASNKIGNHVIEYAEKAVAFLEDELYDQSFAICKAIVDTMVKPLMYTDTSSGIFYQGLNIAMDTLNNITQQKSLSAKSRNELYAYLLKQFKDKNNHGFGYEVDFLEALINVAELPKHNNEIEDLISRYGLEYFTVQYYKLILKFEGETKAQNYLIGYKLLPEIREILYAQCMDREDYDAAKAYMFEGIEANKDLKGVVISWVKNLLDIAEITNDTDLKIKAAKTLFLNLGFNKYPEDEDYYAVLKQQFSKEEWEKELPEIIGSINDTSTLKEIYYRENLLELLFKSVTKNNNSWHWSGQLNFNKDYMEVLLPTYSAELELFLKEQILEFLEIKKGKTYYQRVCETLIMFKKLGMDVTSIIEHLKERYYNRPSLQARLEAYFLS